jgi:hypothetical protein
MEPPVNKSSVVWLSAVISIIACFCLVNSGYATNLEDLSGSVAYLRESDHPPFRIGTGFFVTSGKQYLVTAAHVAKFITSRSILTMRNPGDIPVTISFGAFYPGETELPWRFHPEADVAVLELPLNKLDSKNRQFFDRRFLLMDMLNSDETAPKRERPLVVMGFPLALGTTGRFSPLTVEAKAASGLLRVKQPSANTEATFFVLDKPSIGGYSGAPVFLMPWPYADSAMLSMIDSASPEARPKCVGIVSGTISDDTGGKLAAIVPSVFAVRMIVEELQKPLPK